MGRIEAIASALWAYLMPRGRRRGQAAVDSLEASRRRWKEKDIILRLGGER